MGDGAWRTGAGLRARHLRVQQAAGHLLRDLDQVLELSESQVAWVEGLRALRPLLRVAPLDVGAAFSAGSGAGRTRRPPF